MVQKSSQNFIGCSSRLTAYRFVGMQAVLAISLALCWGIKGQKEVLSALFGAAIGVFSNLCFARRMFAITRPQEAKRIVLNFFLGGLIKWLVTAAWVIIFVISFRLPLLPFVVGFMGAELGFWLAPALIKLDKIASAL